jgi:hypothetical protein
MTRGSNKDATKTNQISRGEAHVIDEWSGLADLLANLIEKYISEIDIDTLPDVSTDISEISEIGEDEIEREKAA